MTSTAAVQRKNMRDGQLLTNAVRDPRIISALEEVKREAFVPPAFAGSAYVDEEVPLGHDRYMLEPLVFATLLEMAQVQPGDRVLVIGAGYGYSAAVLSLLGGKVTAVESNPEIQANCRTRLQSQGIEGVNLQHGPLEQGAAHHDFDIIFIDGGIETLPDSLCRQLAPRGRLVAVEVTDRRPGTSGGLGHYLTLRREHDIFSRRAEGNAFVSVLPGLTQKEGFRL